MDIDYNFYFGIGIGIRKLPGGWIFILPFILVIIEETEW